MQLAPPSPGSEIALVQLPGRMRRALKLFRKVTGLTAVTSVAMSFPKPGLPSSLSPPVHPQCARKLRSVPHAPCGEQWVLHARSALRSRRARSHTCPIGLRCACVPILFGDQLVGIAKLVVAGGTPAPALKTAVSVLKLVVSGASQDSAVSVLAEEVELLRRRLTQLQQIQSGAGRHAGGSEAPGAAPDVGQTESRNDALVCRALDHLRRHYREPSLSLRSVATALGCNPRYLTTRFSQVVGERMRTCLITLRVSHACRLLLNSEPSVKEIAFASGFLGAGRLASAFRTHVGVSPGEYRRIFASP